VGVGLGHSAPKRPYPAQMMLSITNSEEIHSAAVGVFSVPKVQVMYAVAERVGVDVDVGVDDGVFVGVGVQVWVGVIVGVAVCVGVMVAVVVGVGVGA